MEANLYYTIWPEGQPDKAFKTGSVWKAFEHRLIMQLKMLWSFNNARRMRVAECKEGYSNPYLSEISLMLKGAIPPPGGWPMIEKKDVPVLYQPGEVTVRTLSVV